MAQAVNVLHKDSCRCGKSELFTVPPTHIEMNKGFWESVDPVASVQTSDTIEFLCAANHNRLHRPGKQLPSHESKNNKGKWCRYGCQ